MAEQIIKTILKNRCDTATNWDNSSYIPKLGEIILYSDENRIKIGNGNSLAKNLPYTKIGDLLFSKSGNTVSLVYDGDVVATFTDSDTTYINGAGLDLNTNIFSLATTDVAPGTYGDTQTPEHGGSFEIPSLTVDKYGRVTKAETVEVTLPVDLNSDTKTSSKQLTSTKLYILGADTQSATGVPSYSNSNCFISTDGYLYSGNEKVLTSETLLTTSTPSTNSSTLLEEGTFTAITGLSVNGHTITPVLTTYTLPQSKIDDGEL